MLRKCGIAFVLLCSCLLPVQALAQISPWTHELFSPVGAAGTLFGNSVASAGDVNGDGYGDVIIGAPGYSSNTGRAYVYYGGPGADSTADLTLTGETASSFFGQSVASAGDVNGDGYGDVIVGADGYSSGTGRAYVYYGGPGADTVPDLRLTGEGVNNYFGLSVASAGDVNKDGYGDVIIGASGYGVNTGAAYVYYGGAAANTVYDAILRGQAGGDNFGRSVSSAGDVNGDGFGDVIVGANVQGVAYVYYGAAVIMDPTADWTLTGSFQFGISVSSAGDVNGDGYGDVVVGAHAYNTGTGQAYVFYGGLARDTNPDLTFTGEAVDSYFGYSVASAGDVNGDAYGDVIVGAFGGSGQTGRAYVYYGGPGADSVADLNLYGEAVYDAFGCSVASAGDVNGDGYADVIVGAFGNAGRAYVLAGPTGSLSAPSAAAGSAATVTASLEDIPGVTSARLYYRSGGDAAFASAAMTQSPPGTWSAQIPGPSVTVRGVQYYVAASDPLNTTVLPARAVGTASLGVSVANYPAFSLAASPTYQLLGVPLVPANASPASVFDELGAYDKSVWRYGTWDPASNSYKEYPSAANATPGQGFWVVSKDVKGIAINGTSTNIGGNFRITLGPGFNQIANPFAFPVDFADVILPTGVEAQITGWNGAAYVSGVAVLEPGRGYWIRNNGAGGAVIEIPPLGSGVSLASRTAAASRAVGAPGWSVRAAAYAGRYYDDQSRFGMIPGATDAKDAIDFSHPPPPPDGYVSLSFVNDQGNRLVNDFRGESEGATWRVQVASDQDGEPLRLRFTPEGTLPEGLEVLAIAGRGAVVVDLIREPEIQSEVSGGSREWTIVAGKGEYVEGVRQKLAAQVTRFALGRPFPNPAGASWGTAIEFETPVRTAAQARVYDVQGRLVKTVLDGVVERGAVRIRWDARDESGRRAAAGVYLLRLEAPAFRANQKIMIVR